MANNIQDGVYNAIPTVAAVYEKNGMLKLEIHFTLCDESGKAYTQTGSDGKEYPIEKYKYYNLVNAQGVVSTKTVEGISAWSKWDGIDPLWWTDAANVSAIGIVEVTLKTAPGYSDPSKTYQNVEWVNEPGHNAKHGGAKIVESGDKMAIMAKYGAKFKAAFGGKTRIAAPEARPVAAAAPKARQATPSHPAAAPYPDGLNGANAVWDEYIAMNKDVPKADLEDRWFAAVDKHSGGKAQANMTGKEWATVAEELIDVPLPF